jgi:hypothetical protein
MYLLLNTTLSALYAAKWHIRYRGAYTWYSEAVDVAKRSILILLVLRKRTRLGTKFWTVVDVARSRWSSYVFLWHRANWQTILRDWNVAIKGIWLSNSFSCISCSLHHVIPKSHQTVLLNININTVLDHVIS